MDAYNDTKRPNRQQRDHLLANIVTKRLEELGRNAALAVTSLQRQESVDTAGVMSSLIVERDNLVATASSLRIKYPDLVRNRDPRNVIMEIAASIIAGQAAYEEMVAAQFDTKDPDVAHRLRQNIAKMHQAVALIDDNAGCWTSG